MDLPQDLDRLSHEQFVGLWEQVKQEARRGHRPPESYRARLEAEALRRRDEAARCSEEADRKDR